MPARAIVRWTLAGKRLTQAKFKEEFIQIFTPTEDFRIHSNVFGNLQGINLDDLINQYEQRVAGS